MSSLYLLIRLCLCCQAGTAKVWESRFFCFSGIYLKFQNFMLQKSQGQCSLQVATQLIRHLPFLTCPFSTSSSNKKNHSTQTSTSNLRKLYSVSTEEAIQGLHHRRPYRKGPYTLQHLGRVHKKNRKIHVSTNHHLQPVQLSS